MPDVDLSQLRAVMEQVGGCFEAELDMPQALVRRACERIAADNKTHTIGGRTLRRVVAASIARPWEEDAYDMGIIIRRPSDHHVQFMQDGKVLAEWWPSKGTTMMDSKRGPRCATGEDVIAWLKTA